LIPKYICWLLCQILFRVDWRCSLESLRIPQGMRQVSGYCWWWYTIYKERLPLCLKRYCGLKSRKIAIINCWHKK